MIERTLIKPAGIGAPRSPWPRLLDHPPQKGRLVAAVGIQTGDLKGAHDIETLLEQVGLPDRPPRHSASPWGWCRAPHQACGAHSTGPRADPVSAETCPTSYSAPYFSCATLLVTPWRSWS